MKENEKYSYKIKTNFPKIQKISERMAQGKQQPKFERKPCVTFRDYYDTGVRRTNFDFINSADIVKQS